MKITTEQYAALMRLLAVHSNEKIIEHSESLLTSASPPKDLPMRVRRDALWFSRPAESRAAWFDAAYKSGCNDEHIDTALRQAMTDRGLPQFAIKS